MATLYEHVSKAVPSDKLFAGISVILAWTLLDPLLEDLQDTFGKSLFYHPFSLWLCIVMLVYTQTESLATGVVVVLIYESVKAIWRSVRLEPPRIGRLRKLLHRVQNNEKLSDSDLAFLDDATPEDVQVKRKVLS